MSETCLERERLLHHLNQVLGTQVGLMGQLSVAASNGHPDAYSSVAAKVGVSIQGVQSAMDAYKQHIDEHKCARRDREEAS
jgi:hypothetical protein